MRTLIFILTFTISTSILAQSKKEMQTEIEKLKSEITELKKPRVLDMNDPMVKISYSLGTLMASNVKAQGADSLDLEALSAGLKDVLEGKTLLVDQNEAMGLVQNYMQQAMMRKAEKAKEAGQQFLADNKTKEGVITTASGLQYKVLQQGSGKQPTAQDRVTVHYAGTLIDGTPFDSSIKRGQPATFGVNGVIRGWTEALQLMKEGDKWMLYIPYDLAYGERGSGAQIPPYSTLLFEIELIKVN
ncbi:FKBP-type peptidyl-prolyl cis-trans isomerase [Chryseotalea sanaruensis]|uniref:Peptidyl-prolyl cis-trans isomerase n=1 Tax=Chryseotalea sanaruensis TaxID=2482724 RepID=A0A401UA83_9BACT|nr:FKBP-type peptidyl-prolyl cis-trans isomerase [Chryseotalea sanaruensis]GCC51791.1 FKBP-type peptidyl-prolyl cis-trans isomerase [Chryseotalea sanaruensis]